MTLSDIAKGAAIATLLWIAPAAADAMEIVGVSRSAGAVNHNPIPIAAQAQARPGVHPVPAKPRVNRNTPVNRNGRVSRNPQPNPTAPVNRNAHANVDGNHNVQVNGHPPGPPGQPEFVPAAKPAAPVGGAWSRPAWYRWPAGGAVAAGVALGFVTAATATWATPPRPGLCWYYTDPTQQDGFWDDCP